MINERNDSLELTTTTVGAAAGRRSEVLVVMAGTGSALSSIGADLSVSISFSVANEFIAAARESQMGDDELVAVLVTIVVGVTSTRGLFSRWIKELDATSSTRRYESAKTDALNRGLTEDDAEAFAVTTRNSTDGSQRGLLEFMLLLLSIAQSITLSICVQVLAFSVKNNSTTRVLRVTTLLGVVVFFVFFESATQRRV